MKKNVAIIFGGKSAEHDVSIMSARSVFENIDKNLFETSLIGISLEGEFYQFKEDELMNDKIDIFEKAEKISMIEFIDFRTKNVDIVFPVLHGPYGEDGKIQGFFDILNIPYVGCNHLSSAICMDKAYNKQILNDNNFQILPFELIQKYDFEKNRSELVDRILSRLDFPMFIKPSNMGSSIGITKAKNKTDLEKSIDFAFKYDDVVVIEKGINAKELECGIFGFEDIIATEVGEIKPSHEFYDYDAKYSKTSLSELNIPANLNKEQSEYIKKESVRAAEVFRLKGLSRIDFLMDIDSGKIYLSEINTLPGFTKYSMYPLLVKTIGISYKELITNLINFSFK